MYESQNNNSTALVGARAQSRALAPVPVPACAPPSVRSFVCYLSLALGSFVHGSGSLGHLVLCASTNIQKKKKEKKNENGKKSAVYVCA